MLDDVKLYLVLVCLGSWLRLPMWAVLLPAVLSVSWEGPLDVYLPFVLLASALVAVSRFDVYALVSLAGRLGARFRGVSGGSDVRSGHRFPLRYGRAAGRGPR